MKIMFPGLHPMGMLLKVAFLKKVIAFLNAGSYVYVSFVNELIKNSPFRSWVGELNG